MIAVSWKPAACVCGSPHPCWSLDGSHGPWRCRTWHDLAIAARWATPNPPIVPAQPEGLLL